MSDPNSGTYVREFSFRSFEGIRKGRIYRLWAISWQWWTHQWARSRAVKALLGLLIFTLVITNLMLLTFRDPSINTNIVLEDNLLSLIRGLVTFQTEYSSTHGSGPRASFSIGGLSIFILILVALVGSGLISDDVSNLTTEIYYSKLERHEYILGKYGAFMIFGNLIIVLPFILEYILLVVGLGNIDLIETIPVLIQSIVITEVMVITFASVVLGFSALTSRRLYAGLASFMFLFVMNMLIPSLAFTGEEVGFPILFDVLSLLLLASYVITGTTEISFNAFGEQKIINLASGSGVESWMVIGALGIYVLVGFLIVVYQVYWRHAK